MQHVQVAALLQTQAVGLILWAVTSVTPRRRWNDLTDEVPLVPSLPAVSVTRARTRTVLPTVMAPRDKQPGRRSRCRWCCRSRWYRRSRRRC